MLSSGLSRRARSLVLGLPAALCGSALMVSTVPPDEGGPPDRGAGARPRLRDDGAAAGGGAAAGAEATDFAGWIGRWEAARRAGGGEEADELLEEGLGLARRRAVWMETVIRTAPDEAVARALPRAVRAGLPPAVAAAVEERLNEVARVEELAVCGGGGLGGEVRRQRVVVRENGEVLDAFASGKRRGSGGKSEMAVSAVALGGRVALAASPVETWDGPWADGATAGIPSAGPEGLDFFTGEAVPEGAGVRAVAGGVRFTFASADGAERLADALEGLDALPGPGAGSGTFFRLLAAKPGSVGSAGGAGVLDAAQVVARSEGDEWTTTPKSVLYLRVDFSDVPGEPVAAAALEGAVNGPVAKLLAAMSGGRTTVVATASETVLRMPGTAAFYAAEAPAGSGSSRNVLLLEDAKAAARAAGYALGEYDIIGLYFADIGMRTGGIVYAGTASGAHQWLQGAHDIALVTHEFGHNYGLGHASFWEPLTPAATGQGTSLEYGDLFDIMGDGPAPEGHFHPQAKDRLGWIGGPQVRTMAGAGSSAVVRLAPASGNAALAEGGVAGGSNRVLGLRVARGNAADDWFWVGFRPAFDEVASLREGAYVIWQRPGTNRCWLVDGTPGSPGGAGDAGVLLGRTFSDRAADVHITPLTRGGRGAGAWLDVAVEIGPFPGNRGPQVTVESPVAVAARTPVAFRANASDPDGDDLAFFWDFGDGAPVPNAAEVAHAFPVGGVYRVKLVVSDRRGGAATVERTVQVADPLATWFPRASGTDDDLCAIAVGNGLAVAVGGGSGSGGTAVRSADGDTWEAGAVTSFDGSTGANVKLEGVAWTGTHFVAVGEDYHFAPAVDDWVGVVFTSPDGIGWTRRWLGPAGSSLLAVDVAGDLLTAVGENGTVLRSRDGLEWTAASLPAGTDLLSVAAGDGHWVAVGRADRFGSGMPVILRAGELADEWEPVPVGAATYLRPGADFQKVGFAAGRFFASGWQSAIGTSEDGGRSWTTRLHGTPVYEMEGFAAGGGVVLAVGRDRSSASPADINALTLDGRHWFPLETAGQPDRNAVAHYHGTFITAGDEGSLWRSGTVTDSAAGWPTWRALQFPGLPEGSGADQDYDRDGINNFGEYGLGRSPRDALGPEGAAAFPRLGQTSSPPGVPGSPTLFVLTFERPEPAPEDVVYTIEWSPAMAEGWHPAATKAGNAGWNPTPDAIAGALAPTVTVEETMAEDVANTDTVAVTATVRRAPDATPGEAPGGGFVRLKMTLRGGGG